MSKRPPLHDPFLAWQGQFDDAEVRIVFNEMYDVTDDAPDDLPCSVIWDVHVEIRDVEEDVDAMGKPNWLGTAGDIDVIKCLALALVDAIGKRPDWAKDPD